MSVPTDGGTGIRGLGLVRQTAYVVQNVEVSARAWAALHGVGPFFVYDVDVESVYRGTPSPMRGRMALAQSGLQQIELIQADRTSPSLYTEWLDANGTGLHHVCYWTDIDAAVAHFVDGGAELVQHGRTGDGNRFAYVGLGGAGPSPSGVPFVEFVDPQGGMVALFERVEAAARDWSGNEPVRFL